VKERVTASLAIVLQNSVIIDLANVLLETMELELASLILSLLDLSMMMTTTMTTESHLRNQLPSLLQSLHTSHLPLLLRSLLSFQLLRCQLNLAILVANHAVKIKIVFKEALLSVEAATMRKARKDPCAICGRASDRYAHTYEHANGKCRCQYWLMR
jgi:hypothetical protein